MDQLETGKDKIRKICDLLKSETLDPAKLEAQTIIAKAEEKSRAIIQEAEKNAKNILDKAHKEMESERKVFDENLKSASLLALEALRQDIENKLFDGQLATWVEKQSVDPKLQSELFKALVTALEKEGTSSDFSAYIGKGVSKEAFLAAVGQQVVDRLKKKELLVGEFVGGIQLKLHDKQMTLDISNEALKELLGRYIRKDFRRLLFMEE